MVYRKSFVIDSNSQSAEQKKVLLMLGGLFAVIGAIFMLVGGLIVMTTDSAEDYSKTGEYSFFYVNTNRETRTSKSRTNGRSKTTTNTYYIPMYVGEVEGESYTYDYHTEFSSEEKASAFTDTHEILMVSAYRNEDNNIFFLASDITLGEYFQKQKLFGAIFAVFGTIFLVIGLIMVVIAAKKN